MNQLVPSARLPPLIVGAGDRARVHFLEFFTANIRNPNTRRAYARGVADFLARFAQAVYRDPALPLSTRIRCAVATRPFEHPKLSVSANFGAAGFGSRYERIMEARGMRSVIDARGALRLR